MSQQDDYEQTLKAMEQKLLEQRRANSSAKCREDLFATLERETAIINGVEAPWEQLQSDCNLFIEMVRQNPQNLGNALAGWEYPEQYADYVAQRSATDKNKAMNKAIMLMGSAIRFSAKIQELNNQLFFEKNPNGRTDVSDIRKSLASANIPPQMKDILLISAKYSAPNLQPELHPDLVKAFGMMDHHYLNAVLKSASIRRISSYSSTTFKQITDRIEQEIIFRQLGGNGLDHS